jgi:hypothetical protein
MELPEYKWEVSMQLRYVLAWGAAAKILLAAMQGDEDSRYFIQWLTRKR